MSYASWNATTKIRPALSPFQQYIPLDVLVHESGPAAHSVSSWRHFVHAEFSRHRNALRGRHDVCGSHSHAHTNYRYRTQLIHVRPYADLSQHTPQTNRGEGRPAIAASNPSLTASKGHACSSQIVTELRTYELVVGSDFRERNSL